MAAKTSANEHADCGHRSVDSCSDSLNCSSCMPHTVLILSAGHGVPHASLHVQSMGFMQQESGSQTPQQSTLSMPLTESALLSLSLWRLRAVCWVYQHGSRAQELSKIVAENMGSHTSPGLRFLVKASLWLTRNPYAQTTRRLRGLSLDYGPSFQPSLDTQDRCS